MKVTRFSGGLKIFIQSLVYLRQLLVSVNRDGKAFLIGLMMPTLVFIPGLMLTPRLYDPQVAAFRDRFPIVGDTLNKGNITAMAEADWQQQKMIIPVDSRWAACGA